MRQLQHVIWAKGTFLTPQHMQVQDRFVEDSLHFRMHALSFCAWGFSDLSIDLERLEDGDFSVSRASGIFPDGLLFDVPDADSLPPARSIKEFFNPGISSLDVYLAIPDHRQRGLNVAVLARQGDTRYIAEATTFVDENGGARENLLQIARKNLRFLVGTESRKGFSVLRIARVQKTGAGAFRLDPHFMPPLLSIGASESLIGLLRGLVEVLSSKSSHLSGNRRHKNESLAEFTASDIAEFWLLYTVNTYFPLLNHMFGRCDAHPNDLYSVMMSLAGSLTTFSSNIRPRDLPPYEHDELGKVFAELSARLAVLLKTVVPTNVVSLPLKCIKPFIYATSLDDESYLQNTRMFLCISADMKEEELIRKAPLLLKGCSDTMVEQCIQKALSGVQLTHVPTPPSAVPVKLKHQYFSINQGGPVWEAICRSRSFAVFAPSEFIDPKVELLVLLPRGNSAQGVK